jgi:hypothetical protein
LMVKELNILILSSSLIVAFIGLFYVIKIWMVWKRVDIQILKARVFLNERFLVKNWITVFLAGAFIAIRRIFELSDLLGFLDKTDETTYLAITCLFDLLGFIVIVLLVLLAYYWYRLVYSVIGGKQLKA